VKAEAWTAEWAEGVEWEEEWAVEGAEVWVQDPEEPAFVQSVAIRWSTRRAIPVPSKPVPIATPP